MPPGDGQMAPGSTIEELRTRLRVEARIAWENAVKTGETGLPEIFDENGEQIHVADRLQAGGDVVIVIGIGTEWDEGGPGVAVRYGDGEDDVFRTARDSDDRWRCDEASVIA